MFVEMGIANLTLFLELATDFEKIIFARALLRIRESSL